VQFSDWLVVQVPRGSSERPYEDDVPRLDRPVVDTYPVLLGELPAASKEAWTEAYGFWRGTPPVVVDKHPNARAHELIAGVIVSAVRANAGR